MNADGEVHCSLLIIKSQVAPLKKMTILRLELAVATLAVRVQNVLLNKLDLDVQKIYYWSDSMAVLRYIRNETSRFQTFVANRLSVIRDGSNVQQWKFVSTTDNPADDLSRGLKVANFLKSKRWTKGPSFIWNHKEEWPAEPHVELANVADMEIKVGAHAVMGTPEEPFEYMMNYFSNWMKLRKTVAWLLVAKCKLKSWVTKGKLLLKEKLEYGLHNEKLAQDVDREMKLMKLGIMTAKTISLEKRTVADINEAEIMICKHEQAKFFKDELMAMTNGRVSCELNINFRKLDHVLVGGVIRVGGRLDRAPISYEIKHPIMLPSKPPVTRLILLEIHERLGHLGRNSILSDARQKYC